VESWVIWFRDLAHGHTIQSLHRIGAVAWLVRELRRLERK
jgi:hypothetical protein